MTVTKDKPKVERKKNAPDPAKVQAGHLMALVYFVKVDQVQREYLPGTVLRVTNLDTGLPFEVRGDELVALASSADLYAEEVKESKTRVAELLVSSHNRPFTVCFTKDDGEQRTLRGRLIQAEPLLGRSMVEDLDIPKGENRVRLVDHRSLIHLIVDGVMHTVGR